MVTAVVVAVLESPFFPVAVTTAGTKDRTDLIETATIIAFNNVIALCFVRGSFVYSFSSVQVVCRRMWISQHNLCATTDFPTTRWRKDDSLLLVNDTSLQDSISVTDCLFDDVIIIFLLNRNSQRANS